MSKAPDNASGAVIEDRATEAKVLVRQLNQAAWASGNADADDSWKRQERTAATQDRLLNESLAAIDQVCADATRLLAEKDAELQRLREALDFIRSRAHWEDERDMAPGGRWWFALLVDDGHLTFDEALRAAIKP
jgi:hypothetical protein